jgi:hypothetical protein
LVSGSAPDSVNKVMVSCPETLHDTNELTPFVLLPHWWNSSSWLNQDAHIHSLKAMYRKILLSILEADRVNGCHCKVYKQCSNAELTVHDRLNANKMYQIGLLSYCCNLLLRTSHCLPPKCACRPACSISAHY